MKNFKSILSSIDETLNSLADWNNLSDFVVKFQSIWLKLGNFVQQQLIQAQIEETEAQYQSIRDNLRL